MQAQIIVIGDQFAAGYDTQTTELARLLTNLGCNVLRISYCSDIAEATDLPGITAVIVDDDVDHVQAAGDSSCRQIGNLVVAGSVAAPLIFVPRGHTDASCDVADVIERTGEAYRSTKVLKLTGPGINCTAVIRQLAGIYIPGIDLRIIPAEFEVLVLLSARGSDVDFVAGALTAAENAVRHRLGRTVYGRDEDTLAAVVAAALIDQNLSIACAESCTAGLLGYLLTSLPGSSDCFLGGIICYDNRIKERIVGVDENILRQSGAVSEPVASAMAVSIRSLLLADIGVAITGIAGPGGAVPGKPVGTVYISVVRKDNCCTQRLSLTGDRRQIRTGAALAALDLIRHTIMETAQ